jgi:hypothetical protein
MSWQQTVLGRWVYRPHVIRNYYSVSWYGFFVKAISAYRHHLRLDPFDDTVVLQEGIHPEP